MVKAIVNGKEMVCFGMWKEVGESDTVALLKGCPHELFCHIEAEYIGVKHSAEGDEYDIWKLPDGTLID